jgi:prophage regulatory protein
MLDTITRSTTNTTPFKLEGGTSTPYACFVSATTPAYSPAQAPESDQEQSQFAKPANPMRLKDTRAAVQWDRPGLVSLPTLLCKLQLSRSQIYALMARGEFPKQLKIGRSARWDSKELDLWIQARIGARTASLPQAEGYL